MNISGFILPFKSLMNLQISRRHKETEVKYEDETKTTRYNDLRRVPGWLDITSYKVLEVAPRFPEGAFMGSQEIARWGGGWFPMCLPLFTQGLLQSFKSRGG